MVRIKLMLNFPCVQYQSKSGKSDLLKLILSIANIRTERVKSWSTLHYKVKTIISHSLQHPQRFIYITFKTFITVHLFIPIERYIDPKTQDTKREKKEWALSRGAPVKVKHCESGPAWVRVNYPHNDSK